MTMNTNRIATGTTTHHTRIVARRLLTVAVAGVLSLPVTAALAAHSIWGAPHLTVHFVRANLDQAEYSADLYSRVRHAAMQVCGEPDIRDDRRQRDVDACVARSVDRAVGEVASAEFTAVHEKASGDVVRLASSGPGSAR
jgi:UrcA family protein